MNVNENMEYFYMRQYAYDVLRRLLMEEPTVELLNWLKQDENFTDFPSSETHQACQDAIQQISTYLAERHFVIGAAYFEDIHWDFTRLFIGPESPLAPAWESVYVSQDKLLFQKCTQNVNDHYKENGFILDTKEREAADHIGFELDFLYQLSLQTINYIEQEQIENEAFNRLLMTQHHFLQQHILAFSADFCRNVYNNAETPFYRAISVLLQQFLTLDEHNLNQMISG